MKLPVSKPVQLPTWPKILATNTKSINICLALTKHFIWYGFHKQFGDIITWNTIKCIVLYKMNENEISSELYGFHSCLSKLDIAQYFSFRNISTSTVKTISKSLTKRCHCLIVKCNTVPAVLCVPAATLVETYSTQYLMHILFRNTHILYVCTIQSALVIHMIFFTKHGTKF